MGNLDFVKKLYNGKNCYSDHMSDEELEKLGVGALSKAVKDGDLENGCFLSGQVAAVVKKEESASQIIMDVMTGCEEVLKGALKWVK